MPARPPYQITLIAGAGFWTLWLLFHGLLSFDFHGSATTAVIDTLVSNLPLVLLSIALSNMLRFYNPGRNGWISMGILVLILSLLTTLISVKAGGFLTGNEIFFSQTWPLRTGIHFLILLLFLLTGWGLYFMEHYYHESGRHAVADKLRREAELKQLRYQFQPHFLFNSLNSIYSLSLSDPEKSRRMISSLSSFMRNTVREDTGKIVALEDELNHISLYLEIERVRFGNRLQFQLIAGDQLNQLRIPSMVLQPLVENAIKHGLYETTDDVLVELKASATGGHLKVELSNPFDPNLRSGPSGTGFGLDSVRKRLYLLYSRNDLLSTSENENIFKVTLTIPQ